MCSPVARGTDQEVPSGVPVTYRGGMATAGPDRSRQPADLATHRPTWGPVAGVAWIVISALLLIDLLRRGTAQQIIVGVLVVLAADLGAYLFGLQPCVVEWPDGVEIINPLRRVRLRWADIVDVYARDVLIVVTTRGEIRCVGVTGTLPSSHGRRLLGLRSFPGAPQPPPDPEPKGAREVVARITARWEAAGVAGAADPPALEWFPPALLMLALAGVAVVGAFVVGH